MSNLRVFQAMTMKWKTASTLMVTTPRYETLIQDRSKFAENVSSSSDFDILMLKRSAKSSFYPNLYVFPGGAIDEADCSTRWIDLFSSVDNKFISFFEKLKVNQTDGRRSPMFLETSSNSLLKEVAYRICAIRETFEETGILILRNDSSKLGYADVRRADNVHEFKDADEATSWRKRVHDDSSQFFDLFMELKCVPDVWALHEWSNWLTPAETFVKMPKRYDTVFYTASVPRIPYHCIQDDKETSHLILNTAGEILDECWDGRISVGSPQVYELARMLGFTKLEEFERFVSDRSLKGMERCLPISGVTTDNAGLSLYPGDQWYPEEAVAAGNHGMINIPMTYSEMLQVDPKLHNHTFFNFKDIEFTNEVSWPPRYGHVNPITSNIRTKLTEHKL